MLVKVAEKFRLRVRFACEKRGVAIVLFATRGEGAGAGVEVRGALEHELGLDQGRGRTRGQPGKARSQPD